MARLLRALAVGLVACVAAWGLSVTNTFEEVERGTIDQRFEIRGTQDPPPKVVIAAIDEATFQRLDQQWPFPRALHAEAIRRLLEAGARTVVYDVQFSEPSASPSGDRALLKAAADPRVILGTSELDEDGEPAILGGAVRLRRSGGRVGYAQVRQDGDGVWRRLQPVIDGVPQLAVLAAGGRTDTGTRPIHYKGPDGTFKRVSFADLVEGNVAEEDLRGSIVLVGATATSLQDQHQTPYGVMPGVEVLANAAQTILDDFPLREASRSVGILLVLLAGLSVPLLTVRRRDHALVWLFAGGAVAIVVLLAGAQLAFQAGVIIKVVPPVLAALLGTAGAVALTYALEVRTRRQTRVAFERFVPPQVVQELLAQEGAEPRLESRRLEATVLFCDLRGFTSLAERLTAEQVIAVLNRYLEAVSGAVFDHGGTVVSYQGDGVMAVFGAPLPQEGHAAHALAAAREIVDASLPRFNAWLAEEGLASEPLEVGIGINTGPVMSGSVGSSRRIEYAAVGDATNVAARLQALSREADASIFVSGSTHRELGAAGEDLVLQGDVELKGRREPVTVYAVFGEHIT